MGKRVLIVTHSDLTRSFIGRKHYLIKYLSNHLDIFLFNASMPWREKSGEYILSPKIKEESYTYLDRITFIEGYPVKVMDAYLNEMINLAPNISFLRRIISKFEIDLILNFCNIILGRFFKLWNTGKPVIFDFLDYRPGQVGHESQSILPIQDTVQKIAGLFQDYNLRHSNFIVAPSKMLIDYAESRGSSNSTLISNGVDLITHYPIDKKEVEIFRRKLGYNEKDFVIGYIGGINWLTDFQPIFEFLKRNERISGKEIKLLLGGAGSHVNYYLNLAKKMRIINKVNYVGRVPRDMTSTYINSMDVAIIPFKRDLVSDCLRPLKFFEYLACGKPIIMRTIPEIKQNFSMEPINNFLFFADTIDRFSLQINDLIENYSEIVSLNKLSSIRNQLKYYSWENLANKYLELINMMSDQ